MRIIKVHDREKNRRLLAFFHIKYILFNNKSNLLLLSIVPQADREAGGRPGKRATHSSDFWPRSAAAAAESLPATRTTMHKQQSTPGIKPSFISSLALVL